MSRRERGLDPNGLVYQQYRREFIKFLERFGLIRRWIRKNPHQQEKQNFFCDPDSLKK